MGNPDDLLCNGSEIYKLPKLTLTAIQSPQSGPSAKQKIQQTLTATGRDRQRPAGPNSVGILVNHLF